MAAVEPITSLLIRETTIAASAAGKLSGALWQISRVLREHLPSLLEYAKTSDQQGEREGSTVQATLPGLNDPFRVPLEGDYD